MSDLDVATVEELRPEGSVDVHNLRVLEMGWAWYVNDPSKHLPDVEALADMTREGYDAVGIAPDVPLQEIALEPEDAAVQETVDPYILEMPSLSSWSR